MPVGKNSEPIRGTTTVAPTRPLEPAVAIVAPPSAPATSNASEPEMASAPPVAPTVKPLSGLWRNDPATADGKYLVKRRDGTVPEWPHFVLGARDAAAPAALRAYADMAEVLGYHWEYVRDVRALAEEFGRYRVEHGEGDPDRGKHRKDDAGTVAEMRGAHVT